MIGKKKKFKAMMQMDRANNFKASFNWVEIFSYFPSD